MRVSERDERLKELDALLQDWKPRSGQVRGTTWQWRSYQERRHEKFAWLKNRLERRALGTTGRPAKLLKRQVEQIRVQYAAGKRMADLAEAYGVSLAQISRIVNHQNWRDL